MRTVKKTRQPDESKRVVPASPAPTQHPEKSESQGAVPHLRRALGNQAVQRLLEARVIQPKLPVNAPDDKYEREADRVADAVMRMPERADPISAPMAPVQGRPDEGGARREAPPIVHDVLNRPGQPLDAHTRGFMESRFGHGFSGVRVHADGNAHEAARAIEAEAFTRGCDVVFAKGSYDPTSNSGKKLLAHELTHTVQQRKTGVQLLQRQMREEEELLETGGALAGRRERTGPEPGIADVPVQRPDLSALRTIAQGYIGDYFSAAESGLSDFENDMREDFDWAGFWRDVGVGVAFAGSAFASGSTAFIVNLSQVAITSAITANDIATSENPVQAFHRGMAHRINDLVRHLNGEVDRVTREVDASAAQNGWDDNRTRRELVERMVKPEFITTSANGLPNLSQPDVRAAVREELLLKASQRRERSPITGRGPAYFGPAYFEQVWRVDGAIEYVQYPMSPAMPVLKPLQNWSYRRTSARLKNVPPSIPDLNDAINDVYRTYRRRIDPTEWPIEKRLVLRGQSPFGVTYYIDADNNLSRWEAPSFAPFLQAEGRDPDAYLRALLSMIQQHASAAIPSVARLT